MLHSFLLFDPDFASSEVDFLLESFDKHSVLHCFLIPQGKNYRLLISTDHFEYVQIHANLSEYGISFFGYVVGLSEFSVRGLFEKYRTHMRKIFDCYVSASAFDKK